ncbi:sugar phosphate isomerase/epimerase family protein [Kineococcus terrestris]|uniref:sugar phosphate isomerase/epimerase family protein n=1 Tax=Kineococcus terrestris TaxID=2044856 RepID=UPI0034DAD429
MTQTIDPGRISVQLYTLRDALDADADATLGRLAAVGFTQVEPFGLAERAEQLAPLLAKHGLSAPSAHTSLVAGASPVDLDATFAAAAATGTGLVIEPFVDPARWTTAEDVAAVAAELNAAAARAADAGLRVGYHNHWFELENLIGGRTAMEVLADSLDDAVVLEVDTYWAHVGGVADVPALLRRLGTRVAAVHLKDGDGTRDTKNQVALGTGSVDVAGILAAATSPEVDVELGVVELDDSSGDLEQAVAAGYAYLTGGQVQA